MALTDVPAIVEADPVSLDYLRDEIRELTPRAKEFKEHVEELRRGFDRQFAFPIEQARILAARVVELRTAAKVEMLRRLFSGDDVTFPPGMYLRQDVEIDFDEDAAKAYCLEHLPTALTLNVPRFKAFAREQAAKGDGLPFVTIRTRHTPCVAEDLDAAASKPERVTVEDLLPAGVR